MNLMGGGALARFSVFALGISPYITSSIVVQLLSMDVIPALSDMRESGEKGKRKLEKVTRYLAVVLALIQGFSLTYGFDKQYSILSHTDFIGYVYVLMILLAGTMLVVWLGDQITLHGIGNGISMLIFAGIVSELPTTFSTTFKTLAVGEENTILAGGVFGYILYILAYLLLIFFVVMIECGERRIPIQSSQNSTLRPNNMSFIPVKVNPSGVIPVIFAQSILMAPMIVISFFNTELYQSLSAKLALSKPLGLSIYAILAFLITFVYTDMIMDSDEISENLKKSNSYIPKIRPGKDTSNHLRTIINQTAFIGAIGLTVLAVLPYVLPMITNLSMTSALGGTGLIVVVGVALETIGELSTTVIENKYDTGWF